jgi:hypothetical protein
LTVTTQEMIDVIKITKNILKNKEKCLSFKYATCIVLSIPTP